MTWVISLYKVTLRSSLIFFCNFRFLKLQSNLSYLRVFNWPSSNHQTLFQTVRDNMLEYNKWRLGLENDFVFNSQSFETRRIFGQFGITSTHRFESPWEKPKTTKIIICFKHAPGATVNCLEIPLARKSYPT